MCKHAKEVLNGFGLRPMDHAHKHAMDVLKPVRHMIVVTPLITATMAGISWNLLDCTARLCFCTYPQEPMLYVYEGAFPWQMTLVLDRFRAFQPPVHWDLGLNIHWMKILLALVTLGVSPTLHDRL